MRARVRALAGFFLFALPGAVVGRAYAVCGTSATATAGVTSIQAAVNAAPATLTLGDHCVSVNAGTYAEQVTIQGINTNNFRIVITSAPGASATVSPPAASTAAFWVNNTSVTIAAINILGANSMPYGVLASSSLVTLSSVNVDGNGKISAAGIAISSWSSVSYSSVTVQAAHGIYTDGTRTVISYSTAIASTGGLLYALYLNGASSNTITQSYISNSGGFGAVLAYNANYNAISQSTMTSGAAGYNALYLFKASSNTITQSYVNNAAGTGGRLDIGANSNTISQSTVTGGGATYSGLYVSGASSNVITQSYIANPAGLGTFLSAGSSYNTISQSTMATGVAGYQALYLIGAASNTVTKSYMTNPMGTVARLDAGSNYDTISQSTMTSNAAGYNALYLFSASYNTITQSFLTNPAGFAAYLDVGANSNTISQSTMSNNAFGAVALYLFGASSNTVTQSYIADPAGYGAYLDANSNYNAISQSTMTDSAAGAAALYVSGASSNTVAQSYIANQAGYGAYLFINSNYNTISQSTMTSNSTTRSALILSGASSNTITQSYVADPAGYGAYLFTGANYNTISQSTMASSAVGYGALYLIGASFNQITQSYMANPAAIGAVLNLGANSNTISQSTMTSNATGSEALYLLGAASNTITRSYINNPAGHGTLLDVNSSSNTISQSAIISGDAGSFALWVIGAASNTIAQSLVANSAGIGASLSLGSNFNTISQSTMTSGASGGSALILSGSSSNTVTQSYMASPFGFYGVSLTGGANNNAISQSTITSVSNAALYMNGVSSNVVSGSYIQGSSAAYISGSTGAVINTSVLVATNLAGQGVWLLGGSVNLSLSSDTITTGAQGVGVLLDLYNSGAISLLNHTIQGARYGLSLSTPAAGASVVVSSLTFQSLTAGATAVNLGGGVVFSTFSNVNFADASVAVNVNASPLAAGSRLAMCGSLGPRAGPAFANDPNGYVVWSSCIPPPPAPTGVQFTAVSTSSLSVSWTLAAGSAYTMVLSTMSNFIPFISSGTGVLNQNTTSYAGLAPATYYFAVKVSTNPDLSYSLAISTYVPPLPPPPPPNNLRFTAVSTTSLSIAWDLASGNSYTMVLSTSAAFTTTVSSGPGLLNQNTTTYAVTPGIYYFKVKISTNPDVSYAAISTAAADVAGSSRTFTLSGTAPTILTLYPVTGPITLTFPPGCCGPPGNAVTVTLPVVVPPSGSGLGGGVNPLGPAIDITLGQPVALFSAPVSVQMAVPQPAGFNPFNIGLAWWDPASGTWWPELQSSFNPGLGVLQATIWHNTLHGAVLLQAAGNLSLVKVFPNPVNFATAVRGTVKFMGLTNSPTINIYNLAGEQVISIPPGTSAGATINNGTSGTAEWDGRNSSGSPVARGTYVYFIRDASGGKQSGKIGVQR